MNRLWAHLKGARRIELFAGIAVLACLALLLMRASGGSERPDHGRTALESRLEAILGKIEGVGAVSVMVSEGEDGRARGAVIVSDGLDSVRAYLQIQSAVRALLELESGQISIIGKNGFGGVGS